MAWAGRGDARESVGERRIRHVAGLADQGVVAGAVPSVQARESRRCALLYALRRAVESFVRWLRRGAAAGCQVLS
jgi:hypothetical protein